MTIPFLSNVTSVPADHDEPSGDDASRGVPRKRTMPDSRADEPKATVPIDGRSRRITPTVIQVERSPSAVRTSEAGHCLGARCRGERRAIAAVPDGVADPVASTTRASAPSFACTVRAPSRTGPHRWYGEALSHGSGRDWRYGTSNPNTSAALAVFPPEVEK